MRMPSITQPALVLCVLQPRRTSRLRKWESLLESTLKKRESAEVPFSITCSISNVGARRTWPVTRRASRVEVTVQSHVRAHLAEALNRCALSRHRDIRRRVTSLALHRLNVPATRSSLFRRSPRAGKKDEEKPLLVRDLAVGTPLSDRKGGKGTWLANRSDNVVRAGRLVRASVCAASLLARPGHSDIRRAKQPPPPPPSR